MSIRVKGKVGIRRRSPDFLEYAKALYAMGRTEAQVEESTARNRAYRPVIEFDGFSGSTDGFKAADFSRLLGAPQKADKVKRAAKCCPHCGGAL